MSTIDLTPIADSRPSRHGHDRICGRRRAWPRLELQHRAGSRAARLPLTSMSARSPQDHEQFSADPEPRDQQRKLGNGARRSICRTTAKYPALAFRLSRSSPSETVWKRFTVLVRRNCAADTQFPLGRNSESCCCSALPSTTPVRCFAGTGQRAVPDKPRPPLTHHSSSFAAIAARFEAHQSAFVCNALPMFSAAVGSIAKVELSTNAADDARAGP